MRTSQSGKSLGSLDVMARQMRNTNPAAPQQRLSLKLDMLVIFFNLPFCKTKYKATLAKVKKSAVKLLK